MGSVAGTDDGMAYAEAITRSDIQADTTHFASLRAHFDDEAIVELTALIAFQNLSSKFNAALGVEPQGFCTVAPQADSAPPFSASVADSGP